MLVTGGANFTWGEIRWISAPTTIFGPFICPSTANRRRVSGILSERLPCSFAWYCRSFWRMVGFSWRLRSSVTVWPGSATFLSKGTSRPPSAIPSGRFGRTFACFGWCWRESWRRNCAASGKGKRNDRRGEALPGFSNRFLKPWNFELRFQQ